MRKLFSIVAAVLVALVANATVINIDNTTPDALRLALNSANNYDEIVMAAGTYVESNSNYIAIDGKEVFIKAAEGAEVIIQPQVPITISNGGVATFENVKIDASRLTELADWYEHLIYAADGAINGLKLRGCEIYGFALNKSMIYCSSTNKFAGITIEDCYIHDVEKSVLFIENTAKAMSAQIKNSTFENIIAHVTDSYWAGIIDIRATEALITFDHCTFYNVIPMNTDYSAVSKVTLTKGTVSNCIFMLPTAQDGIRAMRGVTATNCITFNYLKDSGTGIHSSVTQTNCVQVDPAFLDPDNGNFTLSKTSPAMTMNDGQPIGDPRWIPSEEPAEPQMKTIYCKMEHAWWTKDGAAIGIYTWDDGGDPKAAWPGERMTPVEGETDIWSFELDINKYKMCIFTRVNGEGDIADWGAKTGDLVIPTDEKDMFTIAAAEVWGDPGCGGEWSKYGYVPVLENGYYLVGNFADVPAWGYEDLTAAKKFVVNPDNAEEYQLENVTLAAEDSIKVVYVENDEIQWYAPKEANYAVDANHAGVKTVYFRPSGNGGEDWWYGCIYVPANSEDPTAIENTNAAVKAVKRIENGQMIIIKNGVKFNAIGTVVK